MKWAVPVVPAVAFDTVLKAEMDQLAGIVTMAVEFEVQTGDVVVEIAVSAVAGAPQDEAAVWDDVVESEVVVLVGKAEYFAASEVVPLTVAVVVTLVVVEELIEVVVEATVVGVVAEVVA